MLSRSIPQNPSKTAVLPVLPLVAALGNVDYCAVLKRYLKGPHFCHVVVCQNAGSKPNGLEFNNYKNCDFSFPVLGCKTIKGADANTLCIFPFRYKGKTYNTCTLKDARNTNNEAWCSTKVDRSGKHVSGKGKWGNCGQGCPFPEILGREGKYS